MRFSRFNSIGCSYGIKGAITATPIAISLGSGVRDAIALLQNEFIAYRQYQYIYLLLLAFFPPEASEAVDKGGNPAVAAIDIHKLYGLREVYDRATK